MKTKRPKDPYQPAVVPPDKVALRNRETGIVTRHYGVDAREILANPRTIYEPVDDAGRRYLPKAPEASNAT